MLVGQQMLQFLEEPALTGIDFLHCSRDPEPLAAIHFRKFRRLPDPGGHTMVNVLLRRFATSTSASSAQA